MEDKPLISETEKLARTINRLISVVGFFVLLFIFLMIVSHFYGRYKEYQTTQELHGYGPTPAYTNAAAAFYTVNAFYLAQDYQTSARAADIKYKDKLIIVIGNASKLLENAEKDVYLSFDDDSGNPMVNCYMDKDAVGKCSEVHIGQMLKICGVCRGLINNTTTLTNCHIEWIKSY